MRNYILLFLVVFFAKCSFLERTATSYIKGQCNTALGDSIGCINGNQGEYKISIYENIDKHDRYSNFNNIIFKNSKNNQCFSFPIGNLFYLRNDSIVIINYNQQSNWDQFYGFYSKNQSMEFFSLIDSTLLFYENGLLYRTNGNIQQVEQPINILPGVKSDVLPDSSEYLYKYQEGKFYKIGINKDIFKVHEGVYFIPYPGINIVDIITFKDYLKIIEKN